MARLHLVPVGETEEAFLRDLASWLGDDLPLEETVLGPRLDPARAFDPNRGQVCSTDLLDALEAVADVESGDRVLGVAGADLFVPILTFVFGEAQLEGRAAVFSTARLDPEFYGLSPDAGLLLERSAKEALHELGHTFGLLHCRKGACVMRASTDADGVDVKSAGYCRACRREIRRSL